MHGLDSSMHKPTQIFNHNCLFLCALHVDLKWNKNSIYITKISIIKLQNVYGLKILVEIISKCIDDVTEFYQTC